MNAQPQSSGSGRSTAIARRPVYMVAILLSAMLTLGACGDTTTAPSGSAELPSDKPLVKLASASVLVGIVTDINERIIPALPASTLRDRMLSKFEALSVALTAAGLNGAKRPALNFAIADARIALDQYRASTANDVTVAVETDVVDSSLSFIALAVAQ